MYEPGAKRSRRQRIYEVKWVPWIARTAERDVYLCLDQRHKYLPYPLNVNLHLFVTTLYRTTFLSDSVYRTGSNPSSSLSLRSKHRSVKGMTFLGGGGQRTTPRSIFLMNRSSNGRHRKNRERERGSSEGEGRHYYTPFGKTMRWGARQALVKWAARARLLTMMEWPEWLIIEDVERVLECLGMENLSSSSSFAVFTCAVSALRMTRTRTRRYLKWRTMEHQHSLLASSYIPSSS